MSTNDVPGNDPRNNDELAMGCWAEAPDKSLILVESTEANRVIFSVFDLSVSPVIEFRDTMPESNFKSMFSWDAKKAKTGVGPDKWTWHDKTPFPWDRVIKKGARDGARHVSADDALTESDRLRSSRRRLVERKVDADIERMADDEFVDFGYGQPGRGSAAQRVADALRMQGREFDAERNDHRTDRMLSRMENIALTFATAVAAMGKKLGGGKSSGKSGASKR